MARAVIVSGGVAHDFPSSSAELVVLLAEAGVTAEVTQDADAALAGLAATAGRPDAPLVVLNLLRWRMTNVERYLDQRERWGLSLSAGARAGLEAHVRSGGGLLALHGASICFDDWPQWRALLGGVWVWGRSGHPPLGPMAVTVHADRHPLVAGLADFELEDEAYGFLDTEPDVVPLLTSPHGGADHPLAWARAVGDGRVVYDALGHHAPSLRHPAHRELLLRAVRWLLRVG